MNQRATICFRNLLPGLLLMLATSSSEARDTTTLIIPPYPPSASDVPLSKGAVPVHFDCVSQTFRDVPRTVRIGQSIQVILENENPYKNSYTVNVNQINLYSASAPTSLAQVVANSTGVQASSSNDLGHYKTDIANLLSIASALQDLTRDLYMSNDMKKVYSQMDTDCKKITLTFPGEDGYPLKVGTLVDLVATAKTLVATESEQYKSLNEDDKTKALTDHQQVAPINSLINWAADFLTHFDSGTPRVEAFTYYNQPFHARGDSIQISVTMSPSAASLSITPGAVTVTPSSQEIRVYGRSVIDYSAGFSDTGLTSRTYYKNAANIISLSNSSNTDLGVAAYVHFVPTTGLLFNHSAAPALTAGIATSNSQTRYLLGLSVGFGTSNRFYLTGGLAIGPRSVLSNGQRLGQNIGATGTVSSLDSVNRSSWFIGISFQFASTPASGSSTPTSASTSAGSNTPPSGSKTSK